MKPDARTEEEGKKEGWRRRKVAKGGLSWSARKLGLEFASKREKRDGEINKWKLCIMIKNKEIKRHSRI